KDLWVNMFINIPNYTQLSVSNYSGGGFNVGCGTCALANFDINTYQVADDFTWNHGRHQIAFGFDGRKDQFNSYNNQQSNGQFTFNGSTSGDGLADLLIGRFSNLTDDTDKNPYGKALTRSYWNLWSPRLGIVWDPKGDGKQTIRASFNLMHDTVELFYPERWTTNAPYVSSITLTSGQFSNPFAN